MAPPVAAASCGSLPSCRPDRYLSITGGHWVIPYLPACGHAAVEHLAHRSTGSAHSDGRSQAALSRTFPLSRAGVLAGATAPPIRVGTWLDLLCGERTIPKADL